MPAEHAFQRCQYGLTAWLRAPDRVPPPADVEPRRLALYRELFFHNVAGFVDNTFPVLKSLLPAPEWQALLAGFFAEHHAQSPYFRDIPLEFRHWLEARRADWLAARPWARELAHYEWMELAADCAETPPEPDCDAAGDLLAGIPWRRHAVWPLVYRWPVHRLGPAAPPSPAPPATPTCLLVYRDGDDSVCQLEVSPLTARLVELLEERRGQCGQALLAALAAEAGRPGDTAFLAAGAGLLLQLREAGIIAGTRPAAEVVLAPAHPPTRSA